MVIAEPDVLDGPADRRTAPWSSTALAIRALADASDDDARRAFLDAVHTYAMEPSQEHGLEVEATLQVLRRHNQQVAECDAGDPLASLRPVAPSAAPATSSAQERMATALEGMHQELRALRHLLERQAIRS